MKNIIEDLTKFIETLTLVDIVFFVAVIVLIILIVTMYYIIKINTWDDEDTGNKKKPKVEELKEEISSKEEIVDFKEELPKKIVEELPISSLEEDILNAVNLLPKAEDEPDQLIDLESLTKAIEYGEVQTIDVSAYEEEQEQKAIISYEELIKQRDALKLNYKEEKEDNGVIVKEIDLANLTSKITSDEEDVTIASVTVISYDQEEAFLSALKQLQKTLT